MKKNVFLCLLLGLSACKKFDGGDLGIPRQNKPLLTTLSDTIPDHASLTLRLILDSNNYDETEFIFNHQASLSYSGNADARYLQGFGKESLSSISLDGTDLAIYDLPYSNGLTIPLDVHSRSDGMFSLVIRREMNIPAGISIFLKDSYVKDSLDLRTGAYSFKIIKTDTNSFGSKRFKLVLKSGTKD